MKTKILRGEMYYADLSPVVGSEQGGMRPVLVLQNNTGNKHSPTVVVAPITSRLGNPDLPTHVSLGALHLAKNSIALLEQIRTICTAVVIGAYGMDAIKIAEKHRPKRKKHNSGEQNTVAKMRRQPLDGRASRSAHLLYRS